jgi:hypothetical protein
MPVVINRDLSSIDSPIRDLIPLVPGVLQNAAPERNVEFETLYNRLAWRFEMKTESGRFGFGADTLENPHRNVIYIHWLPWKGLGPTCTPFLFDAVKQPESIEITRDANLSVRKVFDLLNWANAGERRKKRLKWCSNLPRPNDEKMDKERLEKRNRFFLGVLAFIFSMKSGTSTRNILSRRMCPTWLTFKF